MAVRVFVAESTPSSSATVIILVAFLLRSGVSLTSNQPLPPNVPYIPTTESQNVVSMQDVLSLLRINDIRHLGDTNESYEAGTR